MVSLENSILLLILKLEHLHAFNDFSFTQLYDQVGFIEGTVAHIFIVLNFGLSVAIDAVLSNQGLVRELFSLDWPSSTGEGKREVLAKS